MNSLEAFFRERKKDDIHKWSNYFAVYEHYFSRFRGKPVRFLEIGVDRGGSLSMWKNYFGKDSLVVGVDILPKCKSFQAETENLFVEIGDQSDPEFIKYLGEKYQSFDIILDDGSHQFEHQKKTFEALWKYCSVQGIYMVEDTCTSYYPDFAGGMKVKGTFIEYAKELIDEIHSPHRFDVLSDSAWFSSVHGIYFHSGIVAFEKGQESEPYCLRSGADADQERNGAKASAMERIKIPFIVNAKWWRLLLWRFKYLFFKLTKQEVKMQRYYLQLTCRKALKKIEKNSKGEIDYE